MKIKNNKKVFTAGISMALFFVSALLFFVNPNFAKATTEDNCKAGGNGTWKQSYINGSYWGTCTCNSGVPDANGFCGGATETDALRICKASGGEKLTVGGRCTGCKDGKTSDCGAGEICRTPEENKVCQNSVTPTFSAGSSTATSAGEGQITSNKIPGTTQGESRLIKCGRAGQYMCTLCDMISGMNNIIHYLMEIAIGVALLMVTIGGVMYVVSAGDSGMIGNAKSTIKNAAIGFMIIFAGYLIINTTIGYIGAKKDAAGNLTFGMNITSWGKFECAAKDRGGN